ncbi:MAG: hypothetical protein GQ468_05735 [Candidatus Scalindua sp.]|nr:hypothetical protein [Candidatus Scalindua sp.]
MNSYYYLGHFSKFIRPGAKRIVSSSNKDGLLATAFLNKDNSIVIIVLNMNSSDFLFNTWIEDSSFEAKSPAHSITTMILK